MKTKRAELHRLKKRRLKEGRVSTGQSQEKGRGRRREGGGGQREAEGG